MSSEGDNKKIPSSASAGDGSSDPPPSLSQPPASRLECPICMLVLPLDPAESIYKSCCGKIICDGCAKAAARVHSLAKKRVETPPCAFCREEAPVDAKEEAARVRRRVESHNDIWAMYSMGTWHMNGLMGLPKSRKMALEYYERAYQLGSPEAAYCLASVYEDSGKTKDKKKQREYTEEAARRGHIEARYKLIQFENEAGNGVAAAQHAMIAASAGDEPSLDLVKEFYRGGFVTKGDFASTLRAFQASNDEVKSDDRELAKSFRQSS